MGNSISKVVAMCIAVLILFIFPVKNEFERLDETSRIFVLTETSKFVDSVRNLGYITPVMYQEFYNKLAITNNIYDVQMEHYRKKVDPVYGNPTDDTTFQNDFKVNFSGEFTEDIMNVLFPVSGAGQTYKMSKGDYFAVKVINKNKTMATKIQEMLYNADLATEKIIVKYGGMVKDEDY